ncbi:Coiled-coil and C2 domain-containing protein 1A [Nowakowskiella sp. JEL0407]|nr:Coiled-coil and C2 domain-containing protein 1A [Nowakowskiella sp. JEL0407]
MFGFFGGKQNQSSSGIEGLNIPDLSDIDGLSGDFDGSFHIGDNDLDDPALLAELHGLSNTKHQVSKPQPKITQPPKITEQGVEVDINELMAGVPMDDIGEVELDENDMNDPELLAQLREFGGVDEAIPDVKLKQPVADVSLEEKTVPDPLTSNKPLRNFPSTQPDNWSTDITELQARIKQEKQQAIAYKRAGEKEKAIESLRNAQALESRLDSLKHKSEPSTPTLPPTTTSRSTIPIPQPQDNSEMKAKLTTRIGQYKQEALVAKKSGNMNRAKEMVISFKTMQEQLDVLNLGGDLPPGYVLPVHPSEIVSKEAQTPTSSTPATAPSSSTTPAPIKQKKAPIPVGVTPETFDLGADDTISNLSEPVDLFTHLETRLTAQSALCTSIAAHHYKKGRKEKALEYHKLKKSFNSDLELLKSLKLTPNATLPPFTYTSITYEIEESFPEIAMDEMELCVVRAFELGNRSVPAVEVESYVSFDMGMDGPNAAEGKGDTTVVKKNPNPEYNFVRKIKIERTRAFERYLSRKKVNFEVTHYRGIFTFTKPSKTILGVASLELKSLLNKCEIQEVIELKDPGSRRPAGGKLEIRIRLRTPLLGSDIVTKTERWIQVDFGTSKPAASTPTPTATVSSPAPSVKPAKTDTKVVESQASSSAGTPAKQVSPATSATNSPKPASQPVKDTLSAQSAANSIKSNESKDDEDVDLLIAKFYESETIISNVVLETEVQELTTKITSLEAAKKLVPPELVDRRDSYDIRSKFLVMMVTLGKITMEDFVTNLEKSIIETKKMALSFKKLNRLDMSKAALIRIKLMEKEMNDVKQMMEEGYEDEEDE